MSVLYERCHSSPDSSPPSVKDSPKKPFCPKGEQLDKQSGADKWRGKGGRQRKSFEDMVQTSVVIKHCLNSSALKVTVTHSPVTKRERLNAGSSGGTASRIGTYEIILFCCYSTIITLTLCAGAIDFTEETDDEKGEGENRLSDSDAESNAPEEEGGSEENDNLFYSVNKRKKDTQLKNMVVPKNKAVSSMSTAKHSKAVAKPSSSLSAAAANFTYINNTTYLGLDDESATILFPMLKGK